MNRGIWKDRAILRAESGTPWLNEWYVRFGRRQLLTDWLNEHTHEQVAEMYASTAAIDIHGRWLDLFPIVETKKIRAVRAFFPADLQEADVEQLRGFLDHQAKSKGLEIEPETVTLEVRIDEGYGIFLAFTAIAR